MGLTYQSTGTNALDKELKINRSSPDSKVIVLAGNPNVGKSTIFNNLTGLNQHTGNWPGKTVANATGKYTYKEKEFIMVDIPGTYSLMANSLEEEVARDFICFSNPDGVVVIVDGTCLERNLNLVLQTMEITKNVIVCVNLMDEAERKGIIIDLKKLSELLGVKVVGTSAAAGKGIKELMDEVYEISFNNINQKTINIKYNENIEKAVSLIEEKINVRWMALKLLEDDKSFLNSMNNYTNINLDKDKELQDTIDKARKILHEADINKDDFRDEIVSSLIKKAEEISRKAVSYSIEKYNARDRKIDKVLTSKKFGIPIMILLLGIVFWITITGANYPSELISKVLFYIQHKLTEFFIWAGAPAWLEGVLVQGMYRTLAWVVSVMLPPMAIFFPLFTLLEDLGYLPRIAFNLDNFFRKCNACGKQALTMCMGFVE